MEKKQKAQDEPNTQMPFNEALRRVWGAPPAPKKKAEKKKPAKNKKS